MMTIMITIMITMILAIPFLLSTSVIALLIAVKVKYGLESPNIVALVFRVSVINFTFEIYIAVMLMTPFIFNGVCIHGHTLDLIITRQSDQIVRSTPRVDCYFAHAPMLCHLHSIKPSFSTRTLSYRKIKLVNVDSLNDDLANSEVCKNPLDDPGELLLSCNKTLLALLDKHAPVKTRTIVMRPQVPRYKDEIRQAKRERRKAERRWRLSKLDSDLAVFKVKRNAVNNLMNKARQAFYTKLIEDNSCNQRKLFRVSKRLFNQPQGNELPPNLHTPTFANDFGKYFVSKIDAIQRQIDADITELPASTSTPANGFTRSTPSLSAFKILSANSVKSLIHNSTLKSCPLDPMPSRSVSRCDALLPIITMIINRSLEAGHFPESWKEAVVCPLLKSLVLISYSRISDR